MIVIGDDMIVYNITPSEIDDSRHLLFIYFVGEFSLFSTGKIQFQHKQRILVKWHPNLPDFERKKN